MRLSIAAAAVALLGSISAASAGGLPALPTLPTFSVPVKPVLTPPPMPSAASLPGRSQALSTTASAIVRPVQQARPPQGLVAFEAARSSACTGFGAGAGMFSVPVKPVVTPPDALRRRLPRRSQALKPSDISYMPRTYQRSGLVLGLFLLQRSKSRSIRSFITLCS